MVKKTEFEMIIVDTTVQEKAIAHPTDSRLLEVARHKVASAANRCGIALKQTFARADKELRRKARGDASRVLSAGSRCHAQTLTIEEAFKRMKHRLHLEAVSGLLMRRLTGDERRC